MKWVYTDSRDVKKTGVVERTTDYGGSDVTYFFRGDDGKLDVLHGAWLKQTGAHPIYA